jgi:hypothetical protein
MFTGPDIVKHRDEQTEVVIRAVCFRTVKAHAVIALRDPLINTGVRRNIAYPQSMRHFAHIVLSTWAHSIKSAIPNLSSFGGTKRKTKTHAVSVA